MRVGLAAENLPLMAMEIGMDGRRLWCKVKWSFLFALFDNLPKTDDLPDVEMFL